jgi:DNA-binding beta-propeller fold protein YncE
MKKTHILPNLKKLFVIMTLFLLPAAAAAQSPWQWQMSLRVDEVGDAMYMPSAVAFDRDSRRYYVVDTGRNRLVSFGQEGKVIRAFTANEQLQDPFDMIRLDNGQLWVVEKGRNSLTFIDIAAKKIKTNTLRDGDRLVFPDRIAYAGGRLHVLDRASGQILRLAGDLTVEQRFGCPDCSAGMFDFVMDGSSVLAIEPRDKKIYRFSGDGRVTQVFELGDRVDFPISLDVGPSGSVYVLDRHQNSVLVYGQNGQFLYRFLSEGQSPGKLYFARQLRFDPWENLCIVDEGNGRVEIFRR